MRSRCRRAPKCPGSHFTGVTGNKTGHFRAISADGFCTPSRGVADGECAASPGPLHALCCDTVLLGGAATRQWLTARCVRCRSSRGLLPAALITGSEWGDSSRGDRPRLTRRRRHPDTHAQCPGCGDDLSCMASVSTCRLTLSGSESAGITHAQTVMGSRRVRKMRFATGR